jgi:hypothetical protein
VDVQSGSWIYRVFLLPSTLQVDLAFAPENDFGPLMPTFRLHFGTCIERRQVSPPPYEEIVGLGWLYALHARSCIVRGRSWQAEYMISGVRDNALILACLRHGLPAAHARGVDLLPGPVAARFEGTLIRALDAAELSRAFALVIQALLSEIRHADEKLAARLQDVLMSLAETPGQFCPLPVSRPGQMGRRAARRGRREFSRWLASVTTGKGISMQPHPERVRGFLLQVSVIKLHSAQTQQLDEAQMR